MPPPPPPEALAPTLPDAPASALPEELLEEVFLRLPPDEPAWLVRASLASKLWLGLLTGPAFRGRYHEFHGAPPMLGFFHFSYFESSPPFVPTAKFSAGFPHVQDWIGWRKGYDVWDCRHGRVLLCQKDDSAFLLVAWDPLTGRQRELPAHEHEHYDSCVAAVLCNVTGCNHRACHEGPFSVVLVGVENGDDGSVAYAHVSLPEVGEWSGSCFPLDLGTRSAHIVDGAHVTIQGALYFLLTTYGFDADNNPHGIFVLKYDLGSHRLSLINAPAAVADLAGDTILMAMEDGGLGFALMDGLTLYLWSGQMGSDGVPAWTQRRVMDLKNILPIENLKKIVKLIGCVEGSDIIFVATDLGTYEISLKSLRWKKIWRKMGKREVFLNLMPYMSFYTPRARVSSSDAAY